MKKLAMHWRILLGILMGVLVGMLFTQFSWGGKFVQDWIKPFGTMFINALKMIAIPLIVVSLIKGVSDLKDITKLSKMGIRTFSIYVGTTVIAVCMGLIVVNWIQPGTFISDSTRTEMLESFGGEVGTRLDQAAEVSERGPLQSLVDIIPENLFHSASSNGNMLQVIFITVLAGIALILIPPTSGRAVKEFFDSANEVVMKIVDIIMMTAPYGVFSLIASLVAESPSADIFVALGMYALTFLAGVVFLLFVIYPFILRMWGGMRNPMHYYRGILPAQLVAFSTSSSAATLPVTMECVEEKIGVDKEVSSFVIPIGATINMDGTSMYQAIAAVFIAQVLGYDLTLSQQLTIVLTATLASIGSAAVPGAGLLMLVIVLESIGVNPAGIALIFAIDRPLDMFRTTINVTGDGMVAVLMSKIMGYKLQPKDSNTADAGINEELTT
jgi:proton glutamate symport protein